MYIDKAIHSFENSLGKYIGNTPTNETEYNTLVSEQDVFSGTAPTWSQIQAKATELEQEDNDKKDTKISAYRKNGLTDEEILAIDSTLEDNL